ncbi:MAG: phosphatidylserine decarboxylase [Acidobacteriota bacterium]|nr:phosphatidylserine decarboxylase [Acidobacteriota bacterium]
MIKDAYPFLFPLLFLGALFIWYEFIFTAVLFFIFSVFVVFFFRNPERLVPEEPDVVVSPADGKVIRLDRQGDQWILSIFLSIFDVHVNRAPISGTIVRKDYQPGKFRIAFDERASIENERVTIAIEGERSLTFSLIAGIVARRIRVWKNEGDQIKKGDRIGLIRFGSRVDIVFPSHCDIVVNVGDRVYGGSSILGRWTRKE